MNETYQLEPISIRNNIKWVIAGFFVPIILFLPMFLVMPEWQRGEAQPIIVFLVGAGIVIALEMIRTRIVVARGVKIGVENNFIYSKGSFLSDKYFNVDDIKMITRGFENNADGGRGQSLIVIQTSDKHNYISINPRYYTLESLKKFFSYLREENVQFSSGVWAMVEGKD